MYKYKYDLLKLEFIYVEPEKVIYRTLILTLVSLFKKE